MNALKKILTSLVGLTLSVGAIGCGPGATTGALLGGAGGAGLGAIIGHQSHGNTARGALIGGALGAVGGAIAGNEVDRQQEARGYDGDRRYRSDYYDDDRPRYREYYYERPRTIHEYRVWRDYGPYGPGYYIVREYR